VIYLTAVFYLLSNSTTTYRPMELLSQYSMFHLYGEPDTNETAFSSSVPLCLRDWTLEWAKSDMIR
jgi:hypothetical protein